MKLHRLYANTVRKKKEGALLFLRMCGLFREALGFCNESDSVWHM